MSDESKYEIAELQDIISGVAQLRRWSRLSVLSIVAACLGVFVAILFADTFGSGGASHALSAEEAAELRRENAKLMRENDELKRVAGAVAIAGSGSARASAPPPPAPPPPELVETEIAAIVDGATVEIFGTDQKGPAPFIAKLEKGKVYKARITARGFATSEIDLQGGAPKQTIKFVAKPRLITVSSDPPGALIFVDGAATGKVTPFEIELSTAQAAKKSVRVVLRKSGFRVIDRTIDLATFTDNDTKMTARLDEKLTPAPAPAAPVTRPPAGDALPPNATRER